MCRNVARSTFADSRRRQRSALCWSAVCCLRTTALSWHIHRLTSRSCLTVSAKRFRLTVSIKKAEALHQPYPPNHPGNATVATGDSHLKSASKFCYLGSYVTSTTSQNEDITARIGTTENAGLENTRPVAMERRWYQRCKTEIDVAVRCRKHTRTGNILYAVINSCRKKSTLLTQSELKSLRKIRIHQKSAKNTPFCENCKRNVSYFILSYYRRTVYTKLMVTRTTKHIRK